MSAASVLQVVDVRVRDPETDTEIESVTLDLGPLRIGAMGRLQLAVGLWDLYEVRTEWSDDGRLTLVGARALEAAEAIRVQADEAVRVARRAQVAGGPVGEA